MKKFILVANDAPQSGKTTFSRVLEQLLTRKGIKACSVHTCPTAAAVESSFWDLEEEPEPSRMLQAIEEFDAVILDVAAGKMGTVLELIQDNDILDALLEFDAELCVASAVNGTEKSLASLVSLGEAFSDNASYLLLALPLAPEDEDLADWSGSYAERVMDYLGAAMVEVPELDDEMSAQLWDHGMDLPSALTRRKELPRFLRDAVHSWESSFADALAAHDDLLLPEPTGTRSVYGSNLAAIDY